MRPSPCLCLCYAVVRAELFGSAVRVCADGPRTTTARGLYDFGTGIDARPVSGAESRTVWVTQPVWWIRCGDRRVGHLFPGGNTKHR